MTRANSQLPPARDYLMRLGEVTRVTGLSRSSIYRLISLGSFPSPIKISAVASRWLASELDAWIATRVAQSRAPTGSTGRGNSSPSQQ